eukprot:2051445-Amphidinium_carterae.1
MPMGSVVWAQVGGPNSDGDEGRDGWYRNDECDSPRLVCPPTDMRNQIWPSDQAQGCLQPKQIGSPYHLHTTSSPDHAPK